MKLATMTEFKLASALKRVAKSHYHGEGVFTSEAAWVAGGGRLDGRWETGQRA